MEDINKEIPTHSDFTEEVERAQRVLDENKTPEDYRKMIKEIDWENLNPTFVNRKQRREYEKLLKKRKK